MSIKKITKELKIVRCTINKIIKDVESLDHTIPLEEFQLFPEEVPKINVLDQLAEDIMERWNIGVETKCHITKEVKSQLRARKKTFTDEEIMSAVNNRISHVKNKPEWYNQKSQRPHKINISLVLRNDKDLDKWLNSGDGKFEMFSIKEMTIKKEEKGNKGILD